MFQFLFPERGSGQRSRVKLAAWFGLAMTMSALQLMAHPELDAQIQALTVQLREQPTDAELYLRRADVRRQHAEFDLAFRDIAVAARLKPGWSMLSLVRAKTLFDANRIQEAQRALDEFLEAEPNHATALVLRGRCSLKLGRHEAAIADYSGALKAFAQPNPELFVERAQIQASLGRFDEALRGLDEGSIRLGPAPTLQLAAIDLERQRGNFDSALKRTEKLLEAVKQPATLLLQAQLLEQAGRLSEAQRVFQDVLTAADSPGIRLTEALSTTREHAQEGLARVEAKLNARVSRQKSITNH